MSRINLCLSLNLGLVARDFFPTGAAVWLSDCGSQSARTLTLLTPRLSIVERASRPVSGSRCPRTLLHASSRHSAALPATCDGVPFRVRAAVPRTEEALQDR